MNVIYTALVTVHVKERQFMQNHQQNCILLLMDGMHFGTLRYIAQAMVHILLTMHRAVIFMSKAIGIGIGLTFTLWKDSMMFHWSVSIQDALNAGHYIAH